MRQLTTIEDEAMRKARSEFLKYSQEKSKAVEIGAAHFGFRFGFVAGLDYRQAELARLSAENARLREALTRIVAGHPATNPAVAEQWLSGVEMAEMAREALAGSEEVSK